MKKIEFRRKREGKTNYTKRLKLIISKKPRLVIRISLKNIISQVIEYKEEGDQVLVATSSKELEKLGWKFSRNNLPACYLIGYIIGKKSIKKGIKATILDLGLRDSVKGSKIYAFLKGAIDSGLDIPHSKDILPKEDAIKGTHIVNYVKKLSEKGDLEKVYSDHVKKGIKAEDIISNFEEIKNKIG